jgi:hypothetical protein
MIYRVNILILYTFAAPRSGFQSRFEERAVFHSDHFFYADERYPAIPQLHAEFVRNKPLFGSGQSVISGVSSGSDFSIQYKASC